MKPKPLTATIRRAVMLHAHRLRRYADLTMSQALSRAWAVVRSLRPSGSLHADVPLWRCWDEPGAFRRALARLCYRNFNPDPIPRDARVVQTVQPFNPVNPETDFEDLDFAMM